MTDSGEQALVDHLGYDAMSYLLNCEPQALAARINNPSENLLEAGQEAVLAIMRSHDEQLNSLDNHLSIRANWAQHLAGRPNPESQNSVGNIMRVMSGGEVVTASSTLGRLEATLVSLGMEQFPGLLVDTSTDPYTPLGLPSSTHSHPVNLEFERLALDDPDFKRFFTSHSPESGWSGDIVRSTGQGGGHQLWGFSATIVRSGWTLARVESLAPGPEAFAEAILATVRNVRKAVNGRNVTIPARIGLTGVLLPDGTDGLDLGWARVRRSDARDELFTERTSLTGSMTGVDPHGGHVEISFRGDIVVEMEVPYEIAIRSFDVDKDWTGEGPASYRPIEQAIENLRLAMLLAYPEHPPVLHLSWLATVDPLAQSNGASWGDPSRAVGLRPTKLSVDKTAEWVDWAGKIAEHRTPEIRVAIRRMLASVGERADPVDKLIDAVIVWENLFGARTETTLRVTSALAWLLGDSEDDRSARFQDYKEVYNFRSKVVHGDPVVDPKKVSLLAPRAVQTSIEALRVLFSKRQDLLRIKKSEDRSMEMILARPRRE